MKITKERLRKIILEEMKELNEAPVASGTDLKQTARGSDMAKSVGSAGMGGRQLIQRLQAVIQHIGQSKLASAPQPVLMALQKMEQGLGVQQPNPAQQQGQQQQGQQQQGQQQQGQQQQGQQQQGQQQQGQQQQGQQQQDQQQQGGAQ